MGFTAINSSSPAPSAHQTTDNTPSKSTAATTRGQPVTIASAYLGRGDGEPTTTGGARLQPEKATGKGKKRARTAPNPKESKRRKTSNVADTMPAVKPRPSTKKQQAVKSKVTGPHSSEESVLQHEQDSRPIEKAATGSQQAKMGRAQEADPTSATSLVPVIAPSTSMSILQSTSQQTSFDALKTLAGHGTILYNSPSSPSKPHGSIRFSQPPCAQAHRAISKKVDAANQSVGVQHANDPDEHSFDGGEEFGALSNELAQQIDEPTQCRITAGHTNAGRVTRSATKNTRQQPPRKAAMPCSNDDEFDEDIDGLDEAFALVETAEETSKTDKSRTLKAKTLKIKWTSAKQAKQLPIPAPSDQVEHSASAPTLLTAAKGRDKSGDVIMIDSNDENEEMIELDKAMREAEEMGLKPRLHKQNIRVVDTHEDYGGALLDESEKQLLGKSAQALKFLTAYTGMPITFVDELKSASLNSDIKPIVRSSFPQPVLDRSPIFGASNTTLLRTCFRLGEALNVGSHAVRTNKHVILEIYARVVSSFRHGRKQHFIFNDLYHAKPPYLQGDFELWNQSRLWELDGKAFLHAEQRSEGVMCRAVARMKRDGTKWRLEVFSIWEAGWGDVEAVAGIYAKGENGMDVNAE